MNNENTLQKLTPGGYFHIYNRGNNKETIFKTHENYIYFLTLWKKYIEPIAETFCYNLLPNHFHFFIRVRDTPYQTSQVSKTDVEKTSHVSKTCEVSKTCDVWAKPAEQYFSNLFNAYAKAINKRFKRTGSLFQERFRRKEITDDAYFSSLIGYIITNAVKHGFCEKTEKYPYSAYASLLSTGNTLLLRNEVMDWFGSKPAFVQFIENYEIDINDSKFLFENENDDVG